MAAVGAAVGALAALLLGVLAVLAAVFGAPAARAALRVLRLYGAGWAALSVGRDKSYSLRQRADPIGLVDLQSAANTRKRLVFVRHGESAWNEVFNRGFGPGFPVRLVKAWLDELALAGYGDSVFLDSPLSPTGLAQVAEMRAFVAGNASGANAVGDTAAVLRVLKGEAPAGASVVVASNLRRAMATVALGLQDRLARTGEKIAVLSCLQEISRNVDTLSLSPAGACVDIPLVGGKVVRSAGVFDAAGNAGNKPLRGTGLQRLDAFAEWAFTRSEDTIVVGGHSLFFKEFFKTFLPRNAEGLGAKAKKRKIANCGIVALDLVQQGGHYCIPEASILPIYLGFS